MRNIKPLQGQVLIEVCPPPSTSVGGVALPGNVALSAEIVQEQSHNPEKPAKDNIGIVRSIGAWPKTRKGMLKMPGYGIGQRVIFNAFRGVQMQSIPGKRLRLMNQEDIIAVLT